MRPPFPELSPAPGERLSKVEEIIHDRPEVAGFQSYEYLLSDNARQEAAFKAAIAGNLALNYTRLSEADIIALAELAQAGAESALVTLLGGETDPRVDAMFDAIEYRQSEMFLIYMSARMNDPTLSLAERAEAAEWFQDASEALYGKPDSKIFSAIAREFVTPHLAATYEDGSEAQRLQAELRERIGTIRDGGHELAAVGEARDRFNRFVHERYDAMVSHIVPRYDSAGKEIKYTADEIAEVIRVALDSIGATELGWRCEIVADKELISVSAHQKLVEVGANREPISAKVLRGKVIHEVGVHVMRSVNAEKAGWLSAAYGQQRYLDFEEALANVMGEAYAEGKEAPGPEYRYLIAGFAYGLDGQPKRDMRECYEILWRVIALDKPSRGKKMTIDDAKISAFNQCIRMFRGTPTDIPGLLYTKDLAYIHGREKVYPVVEMVENQEDIDLLVAGKLDPTLEDHLPIAEAIAPQRSLAAKIREHFARAA